MTPINHPDRQTILAELHARPVDIVDPIARVRRLVFVTSPKPEDSAELFLRFEHFCASREIEIQPNGPRQVSFVEGTKTVTWEFHTEFLTVTWRTPPDDKENWPADIGLSVLGDARLIAATRIDVIGDHEIPAELVAQFNLSSLCVSSIENGTAHVATDFMADAEGYTHLEFAAGDLTALRRSVLVRRLLEVETYRSMALLALPLARSATSELGAAEDDLASLVSSLPEVTTTEAIQASLQILHRLSIRSGQLSERLGYRFGAAKAYGEILRARLQGLHEGPTEHGSSLGRYLSNRVEPALATCLAVEKRLDILTDKIERGIQLLNVRIGLDLQVHNRAVLETIARTAQSQFQLQATVEGLSVIAISYYALGILSYVLTGLLGQMHVDKALAISMAAPLVVIFVWWAVRRVRNKHQLS